MSAISTRNSRINRIPGAKCKETEWEPNAQIVFCDPANPEHLSMRCEQIVTDRIKISTALTPNCCECRRHTSQYGVYEAEPGVGSCSRLSTAKSAILSHKSAARCGVPLIQIKTKCKLRVELSEIAQIPDAQKRFRRGAPGSQPDGWSRKALRPPAFPSDSSAMHYSHRPAA